MVHPDFDDLLETVLYINDCYEVNNESINMIVDAYIQRKGYNILVLEWSSFSKNDFFNGLLPNMKLVCHFLSAWVTTQVYSTD